MGGLLQSITTLISMMAAKCIGSIPKVTTTDCGVTTAYKIMVILGSIYKPSSEDIPNRAPMNVSAAEAMPEIAAIEVESPCKPNKLKIQAKPKCVHGRR